MRQTYNPPRHRHAWNSWAGVYADRRWIKRQKRKAQEKRLSNLRARMRYLSK